MRTCGTTLVHDTVCWSSSGMVLSVREIVETEVGWLDLEVYFLNGVSEISSSAALRDYFHDFFWVHDN